MRKKAGVYELWYDNKVYIGTTNNLDWRLNYHEIYKKIGKPDKKVIFKIMENSTRKERMIVESERMIELGADVCMNHNFANKWDKRSSNGVSEEHRKKISDTKKLQKRVAWNKGLISPRKGVKISEETKRKISKSLKGHVVSEETKRKISKSLKNRQ